MPPLPLLITFGHTLQSGVCRLRPSLHGPPILRRYASRAYGAHHEAQTPHAQKQDRALDRVNPPFRALSMPPNHGYRI